MSVGAEGGLWLYQPRPYTSVFPAATLEVYASPHEAALQLEVYFDWTSAGDEGTVTDCDAPSANWSPLVSVGVVGGLWFAQPRPATRMFPAVTLEP